MLNALYCFSLREPNTSTEILFCPRNFDPATRSVTLSPQKIVLSLLFVNNLTAAKRIYSLSDKQQKLKAQQL